MVTLSATVEQRGDASLVELVVANETPVPRRVRGGAMTRRAETGDDENRRVQSRAIAVVIRHRRLAGIHVGAIEATARYSP